MGVMQQFNEPNILTTSTDKLFNWARKNSLWPLQFGLACCAIEMMSTGMAHNDLDRFGAGFFAASPRQADVMIVSGTVSTKMAERMTRLYVEDEKQQREHVVANREGPPRVRDRHLPRLVVLRLCTRPPARGDEPRKHKRGHHETRD